MLLKWLFTRRPPNYGDARLGNDEQKGKAVLHISCKRANIKPRRFRRGVIRIQRTSICFLFCSRRKSNTSFLLILCLSCSHDINFPASQLDSDWKLCLCQSANFLNEERNLLIRKVNRNLIQRLTGADPEKSRRGGAKYDLRRFNTYFIFMVNCSGFRLVLRRLTLSGSLLVSNSE